MDKKDIVRGNTYYSIEDGEVRTWFCFLTKDYLDFIDEDNIRAYEYKNDEEGEYDKFILNLLDSKRKAYSILIEEKRHEMALINHKIKELESLKQQDRSQNQVEDIEFGPI